MDHDERSPSGEPPQKKQRTLACKRCRTRKQKCEDERPCSNCTKANAECVPMDPAPRPQADAEYVKAIEDEAAELRAVNKELLQRLEPHTAEMRIPDPSPRPIYDPQIGVRTFNDASMRRMSYSFGAPESNERYTSMQRTDGQMRRQDASVDVSAARFRRQSELTSSSAFESGVMSHSPAHNTHSTKRSVSQISPAVDWQGYESEEELDHLIYGLFAEMSPHAAISESSPSVHATSPLNARLPPNQPTMIPTEYEQRMLEVYRDRAQTQYPFFHWPTFMTWVEEYKNASIQEGEPAIWQGFFVNMVYATALVLAASRRQDRVEYYRRGCNMYPAVLRHPDPILRVQAYLLLSVLVLHRSSTQRILSLASTTMRYCVQNQLHLAETEPQGPGKLIEIQVRRRCFWSAYNLDRIVMSSLHIPPSIADNVITTKLYANIDDDDLTAMAASEHTMGQREISENPSYTCVSSSLHIVQCRRIQSEIAGYTLRADYKEKYEEARDWRQRILRELESFKARVQSVSNPQPQAKGHTSKRWLGMFYHYTLLMLWRPTKNSVLGPAGDWSVQASSQACLIFRKSQMDRQIAQAWLGLLVQFQSGITLLYCFWATPPQYRSDIYESTDVSIAIRSCSNILAIFANQWPKADCIRDVFELLASEIPLTDRPNRPPIRIGEGAIAEIREKLPNVRALVVHRSILRLIEEMISEDFPRCEGRNPVPLPPYPPQQRQSASANQSRADSPTPMMGRAGDKMNPSPAPRQFSMGSPAVMNVFETMPFEGNLDASLYNSLIDPNDLLYPSTNSWDWQ